MKNLLASLALAAVVIIGMILLTGRTSDRPRPPTPPSTAPAVTRGVPGPRFSSEQINRQRQPDVRRRRVEAWVFDERPLLNALPATVHGVSFEIAGLEDDDRTTIIRADARRQGRRRARIAYVTLRRRTGDRSRAYRLEVWP